LTNELKKCRRCNVSKKKNNNGERERREKAKRERVFVSLMKTVLIREALG